MIKKEMKEKRRQEIEKNKRDFFQRVYEVVKKIPASKVMTYGQVAKFLGTRDARKVGWALHANCNPQVPCHRVVKKDGFLADNYAHGGWPEQKRRLLKEKVIFLSPRKVDLAQCQATI